MAKSHNGFISYGIILLTLVAGGGFLFIVIAFSLWEFYRGFNGKRL